MSVKFTFYREKHKKAKQCKIWRWQKLKEIEKKSTEIKPKSNS